MANKRRSKKITSLWSITQGSDETLEKYTKRFTAAYSCVSNPNEELAIQAYVAGVTNEIVQLALCSNDIESMESLINKAYKLSDTQEMNRNRIPHAHQVNKRRMDNDRGDNHHKKARQVTDPSLQDNLSTECLRATRHWRSEGPKY